MITKLHESGQEDLASRLETTLRENPQVNTNNDQVNSSGPSAQPARRPRPLEPTPDKPTGMQVRLKGKLSDY